MRANPNGLTAGEEIGIAADPGPRVAMVRPDRAATIAGRKVAAENAVVRARPAWVARAPTAVAGPVREVIARIFAAVEVPGNAVKRLRRCRNSRLACAPMTRASNLWPARLK